MRFAVLIYVLTLSLCAGMAAQSESAGDPYSLAVVRNALTMRSGGRVVIQSWDQKHLSRMGDAVSVALLKLLTEEDLSRSATVMEILPIIKDAFAHREFVSIESDKTPRVTILLLRHLQETASDDRTRQVIDETITFVRAKTSG